LKLKKHSFVLGLELSVGDVIMGECFRDLLASCTWPNEPSVT